MSESQLGSFNMWHGDTNGKYQVKRHGDSPRPPGQDFSYNNPDHRHLTSNDTSSSSQNRIESERQEFIERERQEFMKKEARIYIHEKWQQLNNKKKPNLEWLKDVYEQWEHTQNKESENRWEQSGRQLAEKGWELRQEFIERERQEFMKKEARIYIHEKWQQLNNKKKPNLEWLKDVYEQWEHTQNKESENRWEQSGRQLAEKGWELRQEFIEREKTEKEWKQIGGEIHQRLPMDGNSKSSIEFITGQMNSTESIRNIESINGISIEKLEASMRPGGDPKSWAGFLGDSKSLREVLAKDNETVTKRGLTHQKLAGFLRIFTDNPANKRIEYKGKVYIHYVKGWGGDQKSPFRDGTETCKDHTVINLENGEYIKFSGLLTETIDRYGFYEGKGTAFRLDPMAIAKVAGLISMPSDDPVTQLIKNRDASVVIRTGEQLKIVDILQESGIDVLSGKNHQIIPEDGIAEILHKQLTEPRNEERDDTDDTESSSE